MTALLTRIGDTPSHAHAPGMWPLATTDSVPALLGAGYFDRWRALLKMGDTIRVACHAGGELVATSELIVVEASDRGVEVFATRSSCRGKRHDGRGDCAGRWRRW